MANSAASTILTYAYGQMKVDSTTVTTPGLQTAQMLAYLNFANAEWIRAYRRSGGEPPDFIAREKIITLVSDSALNGAITTASTSIILDSGTDFDTSGAIVIWDDQPDIVEHTGKSSNTLSGATGIDVDHADDTAVQKLYALPSNFASFRTTDEAPEGVMVGSDPYLFTSGRPEAFKYATYDNGTTTFLWMPRNLTGSVKVFYNKKSTTIDETTDTVDVPVEYEQFLVYRVAANGHRVRAEEDRANYLDQKANEIMMEAQKEKNTRKITRVRPWKVRQRDDLLSSVIASQ